MKRFSVLLAGVTLALAVPAASADEPTATAVPGVGLRLLASGENDPIAYALYHVPSKQEDVDLILILRNIGAKHINTAGIDTSYFSLSNDRGKLLKIWRATRLEGIAYQSIVVVHICIQGPLSEDHQYALELRPNSKALVPITFKTQPFRLARTKDDNASPTTPSTHTPPDGTNAAERR